LEDFTAPVRIAVGDGLDTLDEVAALKEKNHGIILSEQGLAEVRDALAEYGLTPEE